MFVVREKCSFRCMIHTCDHEDCLKFQEMLFTCSLIDHEFKASCKNVYTLSQHNTTQHASLPFHGSQGHPYNYFLMCSDHNII